MIRKPREPYHLIRKRPVVVLPLTEREKQVINLLLEGKACKEIAASLGLTTGTVRVYLCNIKHKTGTTSQNMLITRAARGELSAIGMNTPEPWYTH